jgi:hypothetical protein
MMKTTQDSLPVRYKLNWRLLILALMLFSFLGPWGYDLLSVPGQFACEWPAFRVRDDFCGYPIPGIIFIVNNPLLLWTTLQEMFNEAAFRPYLISRFGILLSLLTSIPILAALFRRQTLKQPMFSIIVWGVALIGGGGFLLGYSSLRFAVLPIQAWGIWSYVWLAAIALLGEGLPLVFQRDRSSANRQKDESI